MTRENHSTAQRERAISLEGEMPTLVSGAWCFRAGLDSCSVGCNPTEVSNGDTCARWVNFHNLVLRNSKYNRDR